MNAIYCLSGLGADERAFSNLHLNRPVKYISWTRPLKHESIEAYALRLTQKIHSADPILIGLSFGGIMAIEIAKLIPVKKIIIISSIKGRFEMPFWMKLTASFHLHKWLPLKPPRFLEPLENYNLGVTNTDEKILVREYRKKIDAVFLNWAIDVILNWRNSSWPSDILHIHGTRDRIFKIKSVIPTHRIDNGGHFMILNKSAEISKIINAELIK